jgi:2-polyprenyl-3-methyl-5-hydroxy-6-metoxy-1,4-benzoquinol methylase
MPSEVAQFYNSLADAYHLIFEDWDRTIARQAHVLDTLIRSKLGRKCLIAHNCACGIGIQAIEPAALGYRIFGSDLSRAAIQRAAREAAKRGLTIEFCVSDITNLVEYLSSYYDVLGALDNALPHLSVNQLIVAASSFRRVLRAEGISLASFLELYWNAFDTCHSS